MTDRPKMVTEVRHRVDRTQEWGHLYPVKEVVIMAPKKLSGQDKKTLDKYGLGVEDAQQVGVLLRLNPMANGRGYMGVMYQDVADMKDIEGATLKAYRSYEAAPGFRHDIGLVTNRQADRIMDHSFAYADETGHVTASAKVNLMKHTDKTGERIVPDLGAMQPNAYVKRQLGDNPAGLVDRYNENAEITKGLKDIRTAAFEQAKNEHAAQRSVTDSAKPAPAAEAEAPEAPSVDEKAAAREERRAAANADKAAAVADFVSGNEDAKAMSLIGMIHPCQGGAMVQVYPNTLVGETDIPNFNVRGSFFTDEQLDTIKAHATAELDDNGRGPFYTSAKLVKADPETVSKRYQGNDVYTIDLETIKGDGQMTRLMNSPDGPETLAEALDMNRTNMTNAQQERAAAERQVETAEPEVVETIDTPDVEAEAQQAEVDGEEMGL